MHILVVCVGNICRSPMAEALLAVQLPHATVTSAGVGALVNSQADPLAKELMIERGIDISEHRARQITHELCLQNEIIFVMEDNHKKFVEENFPYTKGKVFRLGHFKSIDIPDPYKQGKSAFEFSLALIEDAAKIWSEKIKRI